MGKSSTKQKPNIFKNPLEAVAGYGSDAVNSVAKASNEQIDNIFADMLGVGSVPEAPKEDQMHKGEVELFNSSHEKKAETHARGHIEYHGEMQHSGERANRSETQQMTQKVQEILGELQRLIKSSKAMEMEFTDIAMAETPKEVGNYDMNFFEWMLLVIKQAREKVEDSGAWLSAVKGKNGKKGGGYWDMFKKHGTQFGMSNERSAATSTG